MAQTANPSYTPATRLSELMHNPSGRGSAVERARQEAVRFLLRGLALAPPVHPTDLVLLAPLRRAMRCGANIEDWLLVSPRLIHGYCSWLVKFHGAQFVAIDSGLYQDVFTLPHQAGKTRAQSKFLAITAHEMGHELMRDPTKPRRFIAALHPLTAYQEAEWEPLESEAEAWLFAGFLRAFVCADVGGRARPDEVHRYV